MALVPPDTTIRDGHGPMAPDGSARQPADDRQQWSSSQLDPADLHQPLREVAAGGAEQQEMLCARCPDALRWRACCRGSGGDAPRACVQGLFGSYQMMSRALLQDIGKILEKYQSERTSKVILLNSMCIKETETSLNFSERVHSKL